MALAGAIEGAIKALTDGEAVVELQVLMKGLWTAMSGSSESIGALPKAKPEQHRDLPVFFVLVVLMLIFNWGARFMIEPFLQRSLKLGKAAKQKMAQSFMEMLFYGGFTVLGCFVVIGQDFIWPSSKWWIGFADGGHDIMRSDLRAYYLMYAARYFQGGVSTCLEHKRKDFVEMQIHHWVTVLLVYLSYVYGWNRIGCVVMLLLDPADTFLHIAKICKYTADAPGKPRKALWQNCADVGFALFAVVFFVTRLLMYPYICWSAHWEATEYFAKGTPEWTCVTLLWILMALQMYWFILLIKAIYRMFSAGGIEDIRSDSDVSDVDMPEEPKKKK